MNRSRIRLLAIALLVAIGAVWLSGNFFSKPKKVAAPMKEILVAAQDIPRGANLDPQSLKWVVWPENAITPEMVLRKPKQDVKDFEKSRALFPILKGEPLSPRKLAQGAEGGVLSSLLDKGFRAVAVNISAATAVNGFIMPNDRVDVIVIRKVGGKTSAETLLTNVRVLAVDQSLTQEQKQQASKKTAGVKIATLELAPDHAEIVAAAQQAGRITLALRALAEDTETDSLDEHGPQLGQVFRRKLSRSIVLSRYGVKSVVQIGQ